MWYRTAPTVLREPGSGGAHRSETAAVYPVLRARRTNPALVPRCRTQDEFLVPGCAQGARRESDDVLEVDRRFRWTSGDVWVPDTGMGDQFVVTVRTQRLWILNHHLAQIQPVFLRIIRCRRQWYVERLDPAGTGAGRGSNGAPTSEGLPALRA